MAEVASLGGFVKQYSVVVDPRRLKANRCAVAEAEGRTLTRDDLYAAIMEGAVERVRPKMMTVVPITAGLLPILWSTGTGSEGMQRIAVPMIGGMVSSTILTLVVIPAVYALVKGIRLPKFRDSSASH